MEMSSILIIINLLIIIEMMMMTLSNNLGSVHRTPPSLHLRSVRGGKRDADLNMWEKTRPVSVSSVESCR